jgi:hypothetical protein
MKILTRLMKYATAFRTGRFPEPPPLFQAIASGNVAAVERWIAAGEPVDIEHEGMTPVAFAIKFGRPEILQILLKGGGNFGHPSVGEALHHARDVGDTRCETVLNEWRDRER